MVYDLSREISPIRFSPGEYRGMLTKAYQNAQEEIRQDELRNPELARARREADEHRDVRLDRLIITN